MLFQEHQQLSKMILFFSDESSEKIIPNNLLRKSTRTTPKPISDLLDDADNQISIILKISDTLKKLKNWLKSKIGSTDEQIQCFSPTSGSVLSALSAFIRIAVNIFLLLLDFFLKPYKDNSA